MENSLPPSSLVESASVQAVDDDFLATRAGKIAKLLLQDIRNLLADSTELFDTFFFGRDSDTELLIKHIQDSRDLGENVLVIGRAGIGKTCLLHRCLHAASLQSGGTIHPILCDCRELGEPQPGLEEIRKSLTLKLIDYLKALSEVAGVAFPSELLMTGDPHEKFRQAVNSVVNLKKVDLDKLHPILFVDDIDYTRYDVQEELLSLLLPLLKSPNIVVIYAARPSAARTIDHHVDHRITMAFNRSRKLQLQPISVRGLIGSRLAYLLEHPTQETLLSIVTRVMRLESSLHAYLRRYMNDEESGEPLAKFRYCFNGRVETFMQNITNGNIDEIVDITIALLCYCHKHKSSLKVNSDGTFDLHRKHVIEALSSIDSNYRLIDIHQFKSLKRGRSAKFQNNSTIQNVLEMFLVNRYADSAFFDRLCGRKGHENEEGFGHTREEVGRAIDSCLNRRLIEEEAIPTGGLFRPQGIEKRQDGPYLLTDKGNYYLLDLAMWKAYIDRYGECSRSVLGMTEEGDLGRFQLEKDMLEFFVALLCAAGEPRGAYLKVNKSKLYSLFQSLYGSGYWRRFGSREQNAPEGYSILEPGMFESVLRKRELCSSHKESSRDYFALKPTRIVRCAEEAGFRKELNPDKFSLQQLKEFSDTHTSWGPDD